MKAGMVGLDTSHCIVFTKLLNDATQEHHVPGIQMVAGYPGGSQATTVSWDRVAGYTQELRDTFGLTIYDRIEDLVDAVDAIFVESCDGRQHLEQFRLLAKGKPVFVDKPFATTTADAEEIVRLAEKTGTPLMSCSSLRYAAGVADLVASSEGVVACEAYGPAVLLNDYPGIFWYGVHGAELLFAAMGPGIRHVRCAAFPQADVVTGEWADGRVGVLRGTRFDRYEFGCVVHTKDETRLGVARSDPPYYRMLLERVVPFFQTGKSPILIEETVDIVRFLEAAEHSREAKGALVSIGAE